MRIVVKALREIGAALDRRRLAEMVCLGAPDVKPKARFPIFALDGCEKACARRWLEQHGVTPQRHFVATDVERIAAQIRQELT